MGSMEKKVKRKERIEKKVYRGRKGQKKDMHEVIKGLERWCMKELKDMKRSV